MQYRCLECKKKFEDAFSNKRKFCTQLCANKYKSKQKIKKYKMMMSNDKQFWDWFAGFIEGEGTFSQTFYVNKNSKDKMYYPSITISQAEEEIMLHIKQHIPFGCITKNNPKYNKWSDKTCYVFNIFYKQKCLCVASKIDGKLRTKNKLEQYNKWKKQHFGLDAEQKIKLV